MKTDCNISSNLYVSIWKKGQAVLPNSVFSAVKGKNEEKLQKFQNKSVFLWMELFCSILA